MPEKKIFYYGRILLIAGEVLPISLLSLISKNYFPVETGRYLSLDVLYCLPIIQVARLAAIHATRSSDTQISTLVGIVVAFVWTATETIISGQDFPSYVFLLNTFTRSVVFTVIGRVIIKLWREKEYARKDMLTGLANRVELMERLEVEQDRSERSGMPYSLLFIDVDNFKNLNDNHGHQVGDEALKVLGKLLIANFRKADTAARLGGHEFVMLLPNTDERSCDILIKRIEVSTQQAFEKRSWPIAVSIGQTTQIGTTRTVDEVIHLADENMYKAKSVKQQMMKGASRQ